MDMVIITTVQVEFKSKSTEVKAKLLDMEKVGIRNISPRMDIGFDSHQIIMVGDGKGNKKCIARYSTV